MEFQGIEYKNDSNYNISLINLKPEKNEYEVLCKKHNYSCPIEWSFYEHPTITTKNESLVIFLEEAKKITTNLLIEYVNLADSDNGIFMMRNCYSIQELEHCENLNLYFNTFIRLINLMLEDCYHIESLSDHREIVNDFYRALKWFLRRHLSFLMERDYEKLEMSIIKGQITSKRIINHLNNTECQFETFFSRYMEKMYDHILKIIQDPDPNPENHLKINLIRLIKEGKTWLEIKMLRLKNISNFKKNDVEHVDSAEKNNNFYEKDFFSDGSYQKDINENNLGHVYDEDYEYIVKKYEKRFKIGDENQNIVNNETGIIESEREFEQATKNLLKLISTSVIQTNVTGYSGEAYEVHDTTKSILSLTNVSNTSNPNEKCVKNFTDSWTIITGLSIGFIVVVSLIKCSVNFYKLIKKRYKKKKRSFNCL